MGVPLTRFVSPFGSDAGDGLSADDPFKTVQAAYAALCLESNNSPAFGQERGAGRIVLLPGTHDVGEGLNIAANYPVEIVGTRSGDHRARPSGSVSVLTTSSPTAQQIVRIGEPNRVTYGSSIRNVGFMYDPTVATSLTRLVYANSVCHLWIERCSFNTFQNTTHQPVWAIYHDSNGDASWARIRQNLAQRVGFYKAAGSVSSGNGTNFNRSVIADNYVSYSGTLPMIHLEGDFRHSLVSGNNLEGTSTAIKIDNSNADNNTFVANCGESNATSNPFYDIDGYHSGSVFVGGCCPLASGNGVWIRFGPNTASNTVIGEFSIAGQANYKRRFVDESPNRNNQLIGRSGVLAKTRAAAGATRFSDSHFPSTPDDGTWGLVQDTSTGAAYFSARVAGSWKSVPLT